ncbi:MAG: hypothetical protein E6I29_10825, partial [Chloroflexi bacterium]
MRAHHRAFAHDQCQCRSARQHCRHQDRPPPHATFQYRKAEALALGRAWHNRDKLSQSLTAVILAAGHGTRMRSRIPKVLHPICGRPMIDWVIEAVNEAGAKHVTVIANPHHADVAAHLDGRAELVYQRDPRGTAHALQQIPAGELRGRQVLV